MNEQHAALVTILTGVVSILVIVSQYRRVQGTTLKAPIAWSLVALVCISASLLPTMFGLPRSEALHFAASVSVFCPEMALLGAKRPQNRGWQFIVVTLYMILTIPVIQSLVFSMEGDLDLHWPWKFFLWMLILIGLLNHLASRMFVPALFVAGCQILLLSRQLWVVIDIGIHQSLVAMIFVLLAIVFVIAVKRRKIPGTVGFDRVWIDFRSSFGNLWALRILDRVNQLARQEDWSVELEWSGFRRLNKNEMPKPEIEKCLRTLLRRFVSAEWINSRMHHEDSVNEPQL